MTSSRSTTSPIRKHWRILLKYDSVLGNLREQVSAHGDVIRVGSRAFRVLSERDPAALPWRDLGVDVVFESTGLFTKRDDATKHLTAGAKKVIITAPAKGPDLTVVLGVNDETYDPVKHQIISNGVVHHQLPGPSGQGAARQLRAPPRLDDHRSRLHKRPAAARPPTSRICGVRARRVISMIPTTTGAAAAVGEVLPELKGKLDGIAMRVPTPNVSVVDLVAEVETPTTADEVNEAFASAEAGRLNGILHLSTAPLVSIDFRGNPHSSIVDASYTKVMDGDFVKILSWYDNEWGYASRCVDLVKLLAKKGL